MHKRIADRVGAHANALKQAAKRGALIAGVTVGMGIQSVQAAMDTTAFDTEVAALKTDINYAGQAFLFVAVAVAVWAWIRRAAR